MTPLERFTSMNRVHDAVLEVVICLDQSWGHSAPVREIGELLALPEVTVRRYLEELAAAGLVVWEPERDVAWFAVGVPVLGDVG